MEELGMIETQTCLTCGLLKHIEEFNKAKGKLNGKIYRRNKCKTCINKERKEREKKKKDLTQALYNNIPDTLFHGFTENDIEILKILIQRYKDQKSSKHQVKTETEIITSLLNDNYKKVNKTYALYEEIDKLIKDYCDEKRMFLSDFIMISAIEYINKNKDI